jgi:hypothetical protein
MKIIACIFVLVAVAFANEENGINNHNPAYHVPTLHPWGRWPYASAVLQTPAQDIWNVYRDFGCSITILNSALYWQVVDGPQAGTTNSDVNCDGKRKATEVGVSYNVSLVFPGFGTWYYLRVVSVDDYNMQRCFQLTGPGAFPGVDVTNYISCSKFTDATFYVTLANGTVVTLPYTFWQIWAEFDSTNGQSGASQTSVLDGFYQGEAQGMAALFGNALLTDARKRVNPTH